MTIPRPWLVAPNGEMLPIELENVLSGFFIESRTIANVDKPYDIDPTVHDFYLDGEGDSEQKQIVIWGGAELTSKLLDCVKGERVHLRYLGAYMRESRAPRMDRPFYRWQLWREHA
jgi:hypothetical protein